MFVISQLISPLLPAALVVGQSVAAGRLRKKNIFCVDLPRILMAGKSKIYKIYTLINKTKHIFSSSTFLF
jgi:cation-transporting ATPase 13A3/4/5